MSHGPWEGGREEGLCCTLTCLSVAVTRRDHRCESRAQLPRPPSDTRRLSPTHFFSPFQHVLPPGPQFPPHPPGGRSRGMLCGDAHSTATITQLVTTAPRHSHTLAHTSDTERPSLAPLPTRHLHSDVSAP